ncbi:MAG: pyruvate kinase [Patescibacteria group bacterium]|nr:pyruvate kinase [Patescibacteria group bacterium]
MKTEIIATIGPASDNFPTLKEMVKAGMNIIRLNTKYGSLEEYLNVTNSLRKIDGIKIMYDIKTDDLLPWLKNQEFDYLAVSFAETAKQIKKYHDYFDKKIKIVAKIESKKGIDNIDSLIDAADGIMVARGDLGSHISLEDVPIFQKLIIKKCNAKKKFVITATEMLLSMVDKPEPERAEVSDVANAVLDGSNAVMLSEETSIGQYPALTVKTMARIISETLKNKKLLK